MFFKKFQKKSKIFEKIEKNQLFLVTFLPVTLCICGLVVIHFLLTFAPLSAILIYSSGEEDQERE
jgi:hypothetical protein